MLGGYKECKSTSAKQHTSITGREVVSEHQYTNKLGSQTGRFEFMLGHDMQTKFNGNKLIRIMISGLWGMDAPLLLYVCLSHSQ